MKFGSLFSGIGGIDLGLERAGMECVWQVENNPYCIKVLEKHWPDVKRWKDAKTFPPKKGDWSCDLICGGFPCQPVSLAGKRKGKEDDRWLWPRFSEAVRILRPRYVFVENVPGLLVREMGEVLRDLAGSGYDAEWEVLPAAAFGAPHLRERVFIVAHSDPSGLEIGQRKENRRRTIWDKRKTIAKSSWWAVEPNMGRVAHGVPSRVDRLKCLGNAVVPQVVEWIGRRIMELEE